MRKRKQNPHMGSLANSFRFHIFILSVQFAGLKLSFPVLLFFFVKHNVAVSQ